jgi:predicted DNA-binding transcriptional regulator YafY
MALEPSTHELAKQFANAKIARIAEFNESKLSFTELEIKAVRLALDAGKNVFASPEKIRGYLTASVKNPRVYSLTSEELIKAVESVIDKIDWSNSGNINALYKKIYASSRPVEDAIFPDII